MRRPVGGGAIQSPQCVPLALSLTRPVAEELLQQGLVHVGHFAYYRSRVLIRDPPIAPAHELLGALAIERQRRFKLPYEIRHPKSFGVTPVELEGTPDGHPVQAGEPAGRTDGAEGDTAVVVSTRSFGKR